MKHTYGWIADLPDVRDFLYSMIEPKIESIPQQVDLRDKCSKIEDQKNLGSCTGQALAGNIEFLEIKNGVPYVEASRLFIYYNERALRHNEKYDSGAMIRDGIKALCRWGVCDETFWPYDIAVFNRKPLVRAYKNAKLRKITSYYRLLSLNQILNCLTDGYPIVGGISIYESFENEEVTKTGIVKMPTQNERMIGGHAILFVGFNSLTKMLLVRNSWGENWGLNGYFWLPYEYIENRNLSDDFWTIRKGANM